MIGVYEAKSTGWLICSSSTRRLTLTPRKNFPSGEAVRNALLSALSAASSTPGNQRQNANEVLRNSSLPQMNVFWHKNRRLAYLAIQERWSSANRQPSACSLHRRSSLEAACLVSRRRLCRARRRKIGPGHDMCERRPWDRRVRCNRQRTIVKSKLNRLRSPTYM